MLNLALEVELKDFKVIGHGKDQLPRGCWLLGNARVKGCDYDDADARVWSGHQIRRVYTKHACGLSGRFSPKEQRIAELDMLNKSAVWTNEQIPPELITDVEERIVEEAPVNEHATVEPVTQSLPVSEEAVTIAN